jgi:hypothetical protein
MLKTQTKQPSALRNSPTNVFKAGYNLPGPRKNWTKDALDEIKSKQWLSYTKKCMSSALVSYNHYPTITSFPDAMYTLFGMIAHWMTLQALSQELPEYGFDVSDLPSFGSWMEFAPDNPICESMQNFDDLISIEDLEVESEYAAVYSSLFRDFLEDACEAFLEETQLAFTE